MDISSCVQEDMLSARDSTVASEDSFIAPVSSVGDLMAMSPRDRQSEPADVTIDLLTGADLDSVRDITMQEVQHSDDPLFMDPTSVDYLVKCAESSRSNNHVDHGNESLFIKFDPLFAQKRLDTPTQSLLDSTEPDIGYETGSAASIFADNSVSKVSMSDESISSACEKPTQVVPAVKNALTNNEIRVKPKLVRSASAIVSSGYVATERLINYTGSTPPVAAPRSPHHRSNTHHADRLHSLLVILQKQDHEALLLRQENADLKAALHSVEELELNVKKLTDEKHHLIERENQLLQQLHDKSMNYNQMTLVMKEYEKTLSSLIEERQQEQLHSQEMQQKLSAERDQALSHLAVLEGSFNDLLSKYEKCKSIIMKDKEQEKLFKQTITEHEAGLKKYEELYSNLKQVTSESLAKANDTMETVQKNHSVELTKLNATIKKHEIKISSLEESLTQKIRDNEELSRMCDQLINEVH